VKWILLHYYYRVGIHEWISLSLALACLRFVIIFIFIPVCCFVHCCFALCFSSISFGVWFLEGKEKNCGETFIV